MFNLFISISKIDLANLITNAFYVSIVGVVMWFYIILFPLLWLAFLFQIVEVLNLSYFFVSLNFFT